MSKRRIRTHANPLSYPDPIPRKRWSEKLEVGKPLCVDLGCGQGDYIIACAKDTPEVNFLGIEVRKPMSEKVNEKIVEEKLKNAWTIWGNASVSLKSLFEEKEVSEFTINFPDPWIKAKHVKRRIIKEDVVKDLKHVLAEKGKISLLTDVEEIFDDFYSLLSAEFKPVPYEEKVHKTYWEKWHEKKGTELFKSCFVKN